MYIKINYQKFKLENNLYIDVHTNFIIYKVKSFKKAQTEFMNMLFNYYETKGLQNVTIRLQKFNKYVCNFMSVQTDKSEYDHYYLTYQKIQNNKIIKEF